MSAFWKNETINLSGIKLNSQLTPRAKNGVNKASIANLFLIKKRTIIHDNIATRVYSIIPIKPEHKSVIMKNTTFLMKPVAFLLDIMTPKFKGMENIVMEAKSDTLVKMDSRPVKERAER